MKISDRQKEVFAKVLATWRSDLKHYRAESSGERVTLASLARAGALTRRVWRGVEGDSNAAHEYRPSNDTLHALAALRDQGQKS
jgi:hypothetical protein